MKKFWKTPLRPRGYSLARGRQIPPSPRASWTTPRPGLGARMSNRSLREPALVAARSTGVVRQRSEVASPVNPCPLRGGTPWAFQGYAPCAQSCVADATPAGRGDSQPPSGSPGAMPRISAIATPGEMWRVVDSSGCETKMTPSAASKNTRP